MISLRKRCIKIFSKIHYDDNGCDICVSLCRLTVSVERGVVAIAIANGINNGL